MNRRQQDTPDLWGGLIWFLIGVGLCVGAGSIGLGTFRAPGSGFFPFLVGVVMVLCGVAVGVRGFFGGSGAGGEPGLRLGDLALPAPVLAVLAVYVALLETLGFLLTTFLCLLALFKLANPGRWGMPLLFSATAVGVSYLVFVAWLKNPFPAGVLGF